MHLHIFSRPISGLTVASLMCFVTYSGLSGLSVQLTEDGIPLHGVTVTGPLPNGDGTVQMRLSVGVTLDSSRTYKCEVYSEIVNKSVDFGKINIVQHHLICIFPVQLENLNSTVP